MGNLLQYEVEKEISKSGKRCFVVNSRTEQLIEIFAGRFSGRWQVPCNLPRDYEMFWPDNLVITDWKLPHLSII